MKYIFFALSFLSHHFGIGQQSLERSQKAVAIKLTYDSELNKKHPYTVRVSLVNQTDEKIIIPKIFLAFGSNQVVANFRLEVYQISRDTSILTSDLPEDIFMSYSRFLSSSVLAPKGVHQYETQLSFLNFPQSGSYRYRFIFLASKYNKELKDVASDWATIVVK